jgi:Holliday junction resolvasome RuvABC endonuclease subunit
MDWWKIVEAAGGVLLLVALSTIIHNQTIIEDRLNRIYAGLEKILQIYNKKDRHVDHIDWE